MKDRGDLAIVQFTVYQRPWTTNSERKGNRWQRAEQTAEWRTLFGWLTRSQPLPKLTKAACLVDVTLKGRLQDTGACNPAVKAAIDGIVDGGLIADDTAEHLIAVAFLAPERAKYDSIKLTFAGWKVV